MTTTIGQIFGISFQTELLVMTLLGLANSTFQWKPFELALRLNRISEFHFLIEDANFCSEFIQKIKTLLKITIVIEFFSGLINPLAYLLKLHPVITWSRSEILLPWLTIHAISTLLPKMLSIALAFVFYSESVVSAISLMEFLLVESINLTVAWYNWYVFFGFYLELRRIDIARKKEASREKNTNSFETLSRTGLFIQANDQEAEEQDYLTPIFCIHEISRPAEKSVLILKLTEEDLSDIRETKELTDTTSICDSLVRKNILITLQDDESNSESFSTIDTLDTASCSSFDRGNDIRILISSNIQARGNSGSKSCEKFPRRELALSPCTNVTLSNRSRSNCPKESDIDYLLNQEFELLHKMYHPAIEVKRQCILEKNLQKWLLFCREFGISSRCNISFLRPNVVKINMIKGTNVQTTRYLEMSKDNDIESRCTLSTSNSTINTNSGEILIPVPNASASETKMFPHIFSRNYSHSNSAKYRKSNISLLKLRKPVEWSEYLKHQKIKELRDLQAYNHLTLEQDKRELKKKSKMTSSKNARHDLHPYGSAVHRGRDILKKSNRSSENSLSSYTNYTNLESDSIYSLDQDLKVDDTNSVYDSARALISTSSSILQNEMIVEESVEVELVESRSEIVAASTSMRENIERIDWRSVSGASRHSLASRNTKSYPAPRAQEEPERRLLVDDETMSMLQNAFSYSDESDCGFRAGPEANEPYPIFQSTALTVTEIFKGTGWRNFAVALPLQSSSEPVNQFDEDVLFCSDEAEFVHPRNAGDFNVRMPVSQACSSGPRTLAPLQVLDLSRETFSAAHGSYIQAINEIATPATDTTGQCDEEILTQIDIFKEFSNCFEQMRSTVNILETFVRTMQPRSRENEANEANVTTENSQAGMMGAEADSSTSTRNCSSENRY